MATDAQQKVASNVDTNWVLVDLSWRESLGKPVLIGSQVLAPGLRKAWASAFHIATSSIAS